MYSQKSCKFHNFLLSFGGMHYDSYGDSGLSRSPKEKVLSKLDDSELVGRLREEFAHAIEEAMTHPSFPLMDYHDIDLPAKMRQGGKAPGGGYWEDLFADVCMKLRINTLEDIDRAKELFLE